VLDVPHIDQVKAQNAQFHLYERAKHVFGEAKRVYDYKETCDADGMDDEERIVKLGSLMDESHSSCDELYDCSSVNLNELTGMAKAAGALGSRLTGAGWGGCCVSLVRKDQVEDFITAVMEYYTKEREPGKQLWVTDDLERYIFGTAIG
jgi:galactokinase